MDHGEELPVPNDLLERGSTGDALGGWTRVLPRLTFRNVIEAVAWRHDLKVFKLEGGVRAWGGGPRTPALEAAIQVPAQRAQAIPMAAFQDDNLHA